MERITIDDVWTYWIKNEKTLAGLQEELEALEMGIQVERDYPYKGIKWLRRQFKKRLIVQSKIRILGGSANNE